MEKMNQNNKWEVSIMEVANGMGPKFKVTRRIAEMSIAETKCLGQKRKLKNSLMNG